MEEPLMNLHATTTAEKLLWERHINKELAKENKKLLDTIKNLESGLHRCSREYGEYVSLVKNNNVAQLVNKMKKIEVQRDKIAEVNKKYKREIEDLQCLLAKANLKLKEQPKSLSTWARLKKKFN